MNEAATVLDVRNLRVWYGSARGAVRAVDGVSLDIRAGEVLGLVGESGCGKSTLGRGIMGLLPDGAAVDGEVLYQGTNLVGASGRTAAALRGPEIGLIFQEPMTRLNPLMRIEDHFAETITAHEPKLSKAECGAARWTRWAAWASRPPASGTIRTSSPAACGSGS